MTGIIVLPNYNDWNSLAALTEELHGVMASLSGQWSILIVDDASPMPWPADWHPHGVRCIRLAANQGHQGAIFFGLRWIKENQPNVDRVVVMDADGEDDPAALPTLLKSEADVVFAKRGQRHESWRFQLGYRLYRVLFRIVTGKRMTVGNFVVIRPQVLHTLSNTGFTHFGAALLNWPGSKSFVQVNRRPRIDGQSSMSSQHLVYHGLRSLVENMESLVHWMFRLFVLVMVGIVSLGLYALVSKYVLRNAIPGWTSVLGVGLGVAALVVFVGFVLGLVALNVRWQQRLMANQDPWAEQPSSVDTGEDKT